MKNAAITIMFFISIIIFAGCQTKDSAQPSDEIVDPNENGDFDGNFTLYVSNQSFAISPVDVRVKIDGKLVIYGDFEVGTQHSFVPFVLSLSKSKHKIHIKSVKGEAELAKNFELKDHDVGVITYWYYPETHYEPTPKQFQFSTQKGPLMID